jgi:hypothetical protein
MKYPATSFIVVSLALIMMAGVALEKGASRHTYHIPHYYEANCVYFGNSQGTMGPDDKVSIRLNCQNKDVDGASFIPEDFPEIQNGNFIIAHPGVPVDCTIEELDSKITAYCDSHPTTLPPHATLNKVAFFYSAQG